MKAGYKQTEVGVIPEEWEVKRLHEVVDLQVGFAFKSDWFGKHIGTRLLRGENVGYGSADWSDTRTLQGKQEDDFRSYLLNPGDVVIGMDRTFTKTGSKITLISECDCPCLLVQRVGRFVPRKCEQSFLWFVLSSETVQSRLRLEQKGMDIPHLSRLEILHPFAIFPSPPEQRAIAEALSDVDGLLGGLDRLIAKKRDLKQAAMQQLLTGQTRLPGFHGEWDVKRLEQSCELITKGTTPTSLGRNFTESGVNFLKAESLSENGEAIPDKVAFIDAATNKLLKRSQLKAGDLLISIAGVLGRVGRVSKGILPANTNQALAIVRLGNTSELDRDFLFYCLRSPMTAKQISDVNVQAAQANISLQNVRDLRIHVPTTIPEQTAIAEVLTEIDVELAALEQRREKTRALKEAMMQELLTGRTRLVSPKEAHA